MSFEQDRQETGERPFLKPWGGSGFGAEMVRDKTGPRFVGGQFSTEPRRPYISNYYRPGHLKDDSILYCCINKIQCILIRYNLYRISIPAYNNHIETVKYP